jgi:hypothetical protein
MTPRVVLLSNSPGLRKAVRNALAPLKVTAQRVTPTEAGRVGLKADAIATTTALTSQVAWLSMRLGCPLVFVLPEAAQALTDFVAKNPGAVLAGNDLARADSLFRAETAGGEQEVIL